MKKGIFHNDINSNNFFVQKTKTKNLSITLDDKLYNIKLCGYYLVIFDFGYAERIELLTFDKHPEKNLLTLLSQKFNPLSNIKDFISIFKKYFQFYGVLDIKINNYIFLSTNGDYDLRTAYKK
jgi:hypothetical protein